jgi:deoxyribose-phosphate aldolase
MNEQRNLQDVARLALSCLDLTSLNENDMEPDIDGLCMRAQGPFGEVAAVCVWPRFAAYARSRLPENIAVAAVANFPDGGSNPERAVRDTQAVVRSGAQEVDVVLPVAALQSGDEASVMHLLQEVRAACPGLVLKVILETGVLASDSLIRRASEISIATGADFLKTSTGKTAISATPEAAETMLSQYQCAGWTGAPHRLQGIGRDTNGGRRCDVYRAVGKTDDWRATERGLFSSWRKQFAGRHRGCSEWSAITTQS